MRPPENVGLIARLRSSPWVLLGAYYAFCAALRLVLFTWPVTRDALQGEAQRNSFSNLVSDAFEPIAAESASDPSIAPVVLMSTVAAILLSLPIATVYTWVTPRKRHNKGLAQAILLIPIAVATLVYLVKGSLALAFGLAGIAAAVRFRNTLGQTRDTAFLLMAIGIGLAAGVQLLDVCLLTSLVFNVTMLTIHNRDFGAKTVELVDGRLRDVARKKPKAAKKSKGRKQDPSAEIPSGDHDG